MRCVLQNNIAMIARTFPHGYRFSATIRYLFARLPTISNIEQMLRCERRITLQRFASTFPHGYQCSATIGLLNGTIAYDKQYCTSVFIMRWVLQNNITMMASIIPHGYHYSATIRYLFARLPIIEQMCLS